MSIAKLISIFFSAVLGLLGSHIAQAQTYVIDEHTRKLAAYSMLYRADETDSTDIDFSNIDPTGKNGWKLIDEAQLMTSHKKMRITVLLFLDVKISDRIFIEHPKMSYLSSKMEARIYGPNGMQILPRLTTNKSSWEISVVPGLYAFAFQSSSSSELFTAKFYIRNSLGMAVDFSNEQQLCTLIYGIGLSFIIFNLAMFLFYKKPYFVYYVLYSFTLLYQLAAGTGHVPMGAGLIWSVLLISNFWFACLMSNSILEIGKFYPKAFKIIFGAMTAATVAYSCILAFNLTPQPLLVVMPMAAVPLLMCICIAVMRMLKGYAPAAFLAIGWTVIILGYMLNYVGLQSPHLVFLTWSAYFAYAAESLFFAIALAYRTRDSEKTAQADRIHAFNQLQKIVYPHQVASIQSGVSLEQTMPTGASRACVIAFDIVGSSRIQHINAPDFFRNVFRRCYEVMMEGYNGKDLRANAFRIKEMGDGFLCSIGYPFKSMSANPANDALAISMRFAQILEEESHILHSDEPICCGIGIAIDTLNGFYPDSGTKEYDLYGNAIVLATRYEGMRKALFEGSVQESLIILQEKVYKSLDRDLREIFDEVNLEDLGIVVRDDPAAKKIYTHRIDKSKSALQKRNAG